MVTKKVIQQLYKQYKQPPKSADELDISLLFDYAAENHGIFIDEDNLYIGSVDPRSPFAEIPLSKICQIVEFERFIAIILHASIVFLGKEDSEVNIHVRMDDPDDSPSVWNRLKGLMGKAV